MVNNKFYSFIGICNKAGKVEVGYNKTEEAIIKGKVHLVIITDELSDNTKKKFKNYCDKHKVSLIENAETEELSNMIMKRQAKVIGITDKRMSDQLLKLWETLNTNQI